MKKSILVVAMVVIDLISFGPSPAVAMIDPTNAVTVPEPGAMMLLGIGLAALAGWGRKNFRK